MAGTIALLISSNMSDMLISIWEAGEADFKDDVSVKSGLRDLKVHIYYRTATDRLHSENPYMP